MLAGVKPLAVFWTPHPPAPGSAEFPEKLFDYHVDTARLIKRVHLIESPRRDSPDTSRAAVRIVLYALPSEAWRIEAYLLLRHTASICGWSEGFERMEGSLLGYEDWQNELFIERIYRPRFRSRESAT